MHSKVNEIFKAHQDWLDKGGDQAVKQVREANLVSMMDKGLSELEAEVYQRGSGDGYRIGRMQGWMVCIRANLGDHADVMYSSPEDWDKAELTRKYAEPRKDEVEALREQDLTLPKKFPGTEN